MGQPASERAWASRARKKSNLSPEERERLARYDHGLGRAGRPGFGAKHAAAAAAAPQQPPPPVSPPDPPAPDSPPSGAGGEGGPPIDLSSAAAANEEAAAAEAAASKAAAERAGYVKLGAAYIGQMLRACEPIICAAELPLPPLPEFVLGVTVKCWEITLDKWLPQELGDPSDHAELVACGTSGYQLLLTFWGRKKLEAKERADVPTGDAAAAAPGAPASAPPAAPPKPTTNGVRPRAGSSMWGAGAVDVAAKPPEKAA